MNWQSLLLHSPTLINMTLVLAVSELTEFLEEIAYGHTAHVVFMEELAVVAFVAELPEPVLAHDHPLALHMTERAVCSPSARAVHEELTEWSLIL